MDYEAQLDAAKRDSTLQVLFKVARLVNDEALATLATHTGVTVRASHAALFPHIDLDGTRVTELAHRVGVTKQAVSQLVADLEATGTVERVRDPSDGRAKLVRFTPRGREALLQGLEVLGAVAGSYRPVLGDDGMHQLHELLTTMLAEAERRRADSGAQ